jgi:hypothetical protein
MRAVYFAPSRDITRGVVVGVVFVPTPCTGETVLALPVCLVAVPASEARPRRVAGIYGDKQNARQSCLVGQVRAELGERPVGEPGPLGVANLWLAPGTNALEIFKSDSQSECTCLRNDFLRQDVIDMFLVVGLPPGEFLKPTLGGFGALALKGTAGGQVTFSVLFDFGPGMPLAGGIGGDIGNAEIDTEEITDDRDRRFGHVGCAVEEEFTVAVNEIGLTLEGVKPAGEIFTDNVRYQNAAVHRQETYVVDTLEAERALVVSNGPERNEHWALSLVASETLHGFANSPDGGLRRDTKRVPQLAVAAPVDRRLGENARVEPNPRCLRRGRVERPHVGK